MDALPTYLTQAYAKMRAEAAVRASLEREQFLREQPLARQWENKRRAAWAKLCLSQINTPETGAVQEGNLDLPELDPEQAKQVIVAAEAALAQCFEAAGYPSTGPSERYNCSRCQDTGQLAEGGLCPCAQRLQQQVLASRPEWDLPAEIDFAHSQLQLYADELSVEWYQGKQSPRAVAKLQQAQAEAYAANFSSASSNLFFFGKPGTGKTFLAICLAAAIKQSGKTVAFLPASAYFALLKRLAVLEQSFTPDEAELDKLRRSAQYCQNCDLLLLDDLGSEIANDGSYQALIDLLEQRRRQKKPLLLTSNLSPLELAAHYDERLSSRLLGYCEIWSLQGPDLRLAAVRAQRRKNS